MDFENQQMLEQFFNARQTHRLLEQELLTSPTIIGLIQASELDEAFCLGLLSHMILAKRAPVTALVGLLKHHFQGSHNPHQKCADAILKACEIDLVDYDLQREQVVVRFDADAATHELITQYQYLPPMVVPPLEVTGNRGSGYTTVRTDSLLLQDNHHEGDLCLDHINRCNRVALTLNLEVATAINNCWKNLDKPRSGESFEEFQQRVKAFDRYQRSTAFTMALMNEMGNEFYLTHKYDKRGRSYCQGYQITYQGNTWNKSVIELANTELVEG